MSSPIGGPGSTNSGTPVSLPPDEEVRDADDVGGPGTTTETKSGDGVDTDAPPPPPPPGSSVPPPVGGSTNYDSDKGEGTMSDVGTIGDILKNGKTDGDSIETLFAKLLVAFGGIEAEKAADLVKMAKERAESDLEKQRAKQEAVAELVNLTQGPLNCTERDRVQQKLEEMGYSPEEAARLAEDMTQFGTSDGQQAILIMEAVENAPLYNQKEEPELGPDGKPIEGEVGMSEEDKKFLQELLMLLLGAHGDSIEGGQQATGDTQTSDGGAPPAPGTPSQPGGVQA